MQNRIRKAAKRAFSLVELLVVIAVIGVVAGVATANMSNINGNAVTTRNKKNAQNIASIYGAARAAGAPFTSSTKEGIFDELVQGRNGQGVMASSSFQLNLAASEKSAALAYLSYDSASDVLSYQAGGDQPPTQQQPQQDPNGPPPGTGWQFYRSYSSPAEAQATAASYNQQAPQYEHVAVGVNMWFRRLNPI